MTQFFLSNMSYIWAWPRYHQDISSDKVSWKLKQNYGLKRVNKVLKQFDLLTQFLTQHDKYSIASLMKIGPKLWSLKCSQGFSMIWPTDLVFDPTWPIFELDRDIDKMIILSKFDDDWAKTVASRVFTSQKLTHDPDARRQTETGNNSSPWALRAQVS